MIAPSRLVPALLVGGLAAPGCATTQPAPPGDARGPLVLMHDGGPQVMAGDRRITHGPVLHGLARFVHCVPEAERHARSAQRLSEAGLALGISGGVVIFAGLAMLPVLAVDKDHAGSWLGAGLGTAGMGSAVTQIGVMLIRFGESSAKDAINSYNRSIDVWDETCASRSDWRPRPGPGTLRGSVRWFDPARGFGYIGRDDGPDVLVRASAIRVPPGGTRELKTGDEVVFEIMGGSSFPEAGSVFRIEGHPGD